MSSSEPGDLVWAASEGLIEIVVELLDRGTELNEDEG